MQDREAVAKDDCKVHRAEREKASASDTGDDADDMMTLTNTGSVPQNTFKLHIVLMVKMSLVGSNMSLKKHQSLFISAKSFSAALPAK